MAAQLQQKPLEIDYKRFRLTGRILEGPLYKQGRFNRAWRERQFGIDVKTLKAKYLILVQYRCQII